MAIASAPNARQRSALIRQLPVSVSLNQQADGRLVKNFFYRGKLLRLSVVERAAREREHDDDAASGPYLAESAPADGSELCFDGEQPPCATEAEMDELAMLIAYTQTEAQMVHDEVQHEIMFLECWDATDEIQSGPSRTFNCAAEGLATTGAAALAIHTNMQAYGAA